MPKASKTWTDVRTELLNDPDFKHTWEATEPFAEISREIIRVRLEKGLTQRQLAEKIGTSASQISRLESFNYSRMKVDTLVRIAEALGMRLAVSFQEAS